MLKSIKRGIYSNRNLIESDSGSDHDCLEVLETLTWEANQTGQILEFDDFENEILNRCSLMGIEDIYNTRIMYKEYLRAAGSKETGNDEQGYADLIIQLVRDSKQAGRIVDNMDDLYEFAIDYIYSGRFKINFEIDKDDLYSDYLKAIDDDGYFIESAKTNKKRIKEAKFEFYKKDGGKIGVKAPKMISKSSKTTNKESDIDSHEEWVDVDLNSKMGQYAKEAFSVAKEAGKLGKIVNKEDTDSADIELDYQDRVILTPDGSNKKEVIGNLKERKMKREWVRKLKENRKDFKNKKLSRILNIPYTEAKYLK